MRKLSTTWHHQKTLPLNPQLPLKHSEHLHQNCGKRRLGRLLITSASVPLTTPANEASETVTTASCTTDEGNSGDPPSSFLSTFSMDSDFIKELEKVESAHSNGIHKSQSKLASFSALKNETLKEKANTENVIVKPTLNSPGCELVGKRKYIKASVVSSHFNIICGEQPLNHNHKSELNSTVSPTSSPVDKRPKHSINAAKSHKLSNGSSTNRNFSCKSPVFSVPVKSHNADASSVAAAVISANDASPSLIGNYNGDDSFNFPDISFSPLCCSQDGDLFDIREQESPQLKHSICRDLLNNTDHHSNEADVSSQRQLIIGCINLDNAVTRQQETENINCNSGSNSELIMETEKSISSVLSQKRLSHNQFHSPDSTKKKGRQSQNKELFKKVKKTIPFGNQANTSKCLKDINMQLNVVPGSFIDCESDQISKNTTLKSCRTNESQQTNVNIGGHDSHNFSGSESPDDIISRNITPEVRSDFKKGEIHLSSTVNAVSFQEKSFGSVSLSVDKRQLSSWGLPEPVLEAYRCQGVQTMFEWQTECLLTGNVLEGGNLIYSAPTSAGKTLVAELLILKRVLESKKKALFILPFVSVVREKMYSLQKLFQDAGIRVGGYMGSHTPPGGFSRVHIAVCTIEKGNGLINRLMEEGKLGELGAVVVDELHMVGDSHRGYLLELMLTKLAYIAQRTKDGSSDCQVQIIGMSATLPNLSLLSKWLNASLYCTDFRPVPLTEYIKVDSKLLNGQLIVQREIPALLISPDDADHVIALCIESVSDGHGVLVFCPTKNWCEKLCEAIARRIYTLQAQNRTKENNDGVSGSTSVGGVRVNLDRSSLMETVEQLRRSPVGLDSMLGKCVLNGVAYHHAGLTFDERDIIEGAFRQGHLKILVATSTLSSGVNLPARRVIIRTPMFYGKVIDTLTYKQMVGRAGRKGMDTEGESILICKPQEKNIGGKLVAAELPSVESCLHFDTEDGLSGSLKRAVLEVVVSGVAASPEDVITYVNCTLLSASLSQDTRTSLKTTMAESCIKFLQENEFVSVKVTHNEDGKETRKFYPTQLGAAILASSLSPDEGLLVFAELQKARRAFVLDTELHIIYLVTPVYTSDVSATIDWYHFHHQWEMLMPADRRVADLVGVSEAFIARAIQGRINGKTEAQRKALAIHRRFYTALVLNYLVQESPLMEVAARFNSNKGQLQSLQQSASTYAGMITVFCGRLGWHSLELILSQFHKRLSFGVQQELVDLVRISTVNASSARMLYNAGYHTVTDVAKAESSDIENLFKSTVPFQSDKRQDGETEWELKERRRARCIWLTGRKGVTELDAALVIIEEAKVIIQGDFGVSGITWGAKDKVEECSVADCSEGQEASTVDGAHAEIYQSAEFRDSGGSSHPHNSQIKINTADIEVEPQVHTDSIGVVMTTQDVTISKVVRSSLHEKRVGAGKLSPRKLSNIRRPGSFRKNGHSSYYQTKRRDRSFFGQMVVSPPEGIRNRVSDNVHSTRTESNNAEGTRTINYNVNSSRTTSDNVDSTRTTIDNVNSIRTISDNVNSTRPERDNIDLARTASVNVNSTRTASVNVKSTRTASDNVNSTRTTSANVNSTRTESNNVDSTRTASDNVNSTRTESNNIDSTRTASDNVNSARTESNNIDSTRTASDNVNSARTECNNVDSTRTESDNVNSTKTTSINVRFENSSQSSHYKDITDGKIANKVNNSTDEAAVIKDNIAIPPVLAHCDSAVFPHCGSAITTISKDLAVNNTSEVCSVITTALSFPAKESCVEEYGGSILESSVSFSESFELDTQTANIISHNGQDMKQNQQTTPVRSSLVRTSASKFRLSNQNSDVKICQMSAAPVSVLNNVLQTQANCDELDTSGDNGSRRDSPDPFMDSMTEALLFDYGNVEQVTPQNMFVSNVSSENIHGSFSEALFDSSEKHIQKKLIINDEQITPKRTTTKSVHTLMSSFNSFNVANNNKICSIKATRHNCESVSESITLSHSLTDSLMNNYAHNSQGKYCDEEEVHSSLNTSNFERPMHLDEGMMEEESEQSDSLNYSCVNLVRSHEANNHQILTGCNGRKVRGINSKHMTRHAVEDEKNAHKEISENGLLHVSFKYLIANTHEKALMTTSGKNYTSTSVPSDSSKKLSVSKFGSTVSLPRVSTPLITPNIKGLNHKPMSQIKNISTGQTNVKFVLEEGNEKIIISKQDKICQPEMTDISGLDEFFTDSFSSSLMGEIIAECHDISETRSRNKKAKVPNKTCCAAFSERSKTDGEGGSKKLDLCNTSPSTSKRTTEPLSNNSSRSDTSDCVPPTPPDETSVTASPFKISFYSPLKPTVSTACNSILVPNKRAPKYLSSKLKKTDFTAIKDIHLQDSFLPHQLNTRIQATDVHCSGACGTNQHLAKPVDKSPFVQKQNKCSTTSTEVSHANSTREKMPVGSPFHERHPYISASQLLTQQSFTIVDVCADRRLFETFLAELKSKPYYALSVACEKKPLEIKQGTSSAIGGRFLRKRASSSFTKSKTAVGIPIPDSDAFIVGLAVSWENRDSYFVSFMPADLTEPSEPNPDDTLDEPPLDVSLTQEDRLSSLLAVLSSNPGSSKHTVATYDSKATYLCLAKTLGLSLSHCEDPCVANWLKEPDARLKNLHQLVMSHCPEELGLLNAVGGVNGYQSMGSDIKSIVAGRLRACTECVLTQKLMSKFHTLLSDDHLLDAFTRVEMPAIITLARMELNGFGICESEIEKQKTLLTVKLNILEEQAYKMAGHVFSLISTTDVATVLYIELKLPVNGDPTLVPHLPMHGRRGQRPPIGGTSKEILEKLQKFHPLPGVILEWRRLSSALTKSLFPLKRAARPCPLLDMVRVFGDSQIFTSTGRVSMAEPNLQNIPKDFAIDLLNFNGEAVSAVASSSAIKASDTNIRVVAFDGDKHRGNQHGLEQVHLKYTATTPVSMRKMFVPFRGGVILAADYSQLELRIIAHLSGDSKLASILNTADGDVFKIIAAQMKHLNILEVSSEHRQQAKQVCYGMLYGIGPKALGEQLGMDENDADVFMETFKSRYPGIRKYLQKTVEFCQKNGYVKTLFNRRRYLPSIKDINPHARAQAERQAVNTTIQGSAADLVKIAMAKIDRKLMDLFPDTKKCHSQALPTKDLSNRKNNKTPPVIGAFLVLQLHDELLYEVSAAHALEVARVIKHYMETAVKLSICMPVKIKVGPSWGELVDYEVPE